MEPFSSASIILPVIDETYSLEQTVQVIEQSCAPGEIKEFIIVYCKRTTEQSLAVCRRLASALGEKCRLHEQVLPFIGGAMREAFDLARGSHVVMMSSDLETDPAVVKVFIEQARRKPEAVITASRWIQGGRFEGYNRPKLIFNWLFQKAFALVYGCRLTDLTYAYRIFPTALVQSIAWEELKHPFFLETAIKPLRLGVPFLEVPAVWKARTEGASQNPFWYNFVYFRIALKVRFYSRHRVLRPGCAHALSIKYV
jgi:hypothetical protein